MTVEKLRATIDKSIRDMPVELWARFMSKVKAKPGRTVTQVQIELISNWLAEEED